MSLLRSGASKKYSDNWAAAFGRSSKKKKLTAKASAKKTKAKARKSSTKKK